MVRLVGSACVSCGVKQNVREGAINEGAVGVHNVYNRAQLALIWAKVDECYPTDLCVACERLSSHHVHCQTKPQHQSSARPVCALQSHSHTATATWPHTCIHSHTRTMVEFLEEC